MRQLTCDIRIGQFQFFFVTEVSIESSWKQLTDRAQITLPRKLKWKDKYLRDEIKRGDGVEIYLGYDFDMNLEFSGYVSEVRNGVPVEILCEDEMWQLKQTNITKAWRTVTLPVMLKEIVPAGITVNALDADLGPFRINKVSVAKVLEKLRQVYGFVSFFRDGVLQVGYPYSQVQSDRGAFLFEGDIISNRLEYKKADDTKIKVRAISVLPGGDVIERELGAQDGEIHTLHFYNLSAAQLLQSAEEEAKRLRYEGYRGDFETFGAPYLQHSDIADLNSIEYPERAGSYLIDETKVRFGMQGFRRSIKLGPKV